MFQSASCRCERACRANNFKRADKADIFRNEINFEQLHNRIGMLPIVECDRFI